MWYMPYMRVRHAVLIYAFIAIGLTLVGVALRFWPGAVHPDADAHSFRIDVAALIAGSAALVGGLATVLGLNLAAENDGHLEVAWTKPVSRESYALGVFAVDIAAMAVCIVFTAVLAAVIVDVYAGDQAITLPAGGKLLLTLAFCGAPLCVYAWIAALSASLKRNRGAIAGIFWPAMFVLALLHAVPSPAVHAVVTTLDLLNPVMIFSWNSLAPPSVWTFAWGWLVATLLLAAAILQWRRLQL